MVAAALVACMLHRPAPGRAEASPPDKAETGTLILDESAYWRYHLQGHPAKLSYELMKQSAEKVLGEKPFKSLRDRHVRKLRKEGREGDDWRKGLTYHTYYFNDPKVKSTPPPPDWMKPGFDDSDWGRYQKPFKMGKDFRADGYTEHLFQVHPVCFRARFDIPDPRQAGNLHLRLVYRGGIRAFLNGKEIARGHLPAGKLAPDTPARPYPPEAYYLLDDEHPKGIPGQKRKPRCLVGNGVYVMNDLGVFARSQGWEELAKVDAPGGPYVGTRSLGMGLKDGFVNRKGWDRIVRLRDRVLEVKIPASQIRKGGNVLALELRSSQLGPVALIWRVSWGGSGSWKHCWLLKVSLRAAGKDVPSALKRPPGVQVWVEDIHHRLFSPEFHPPGDLPRRARIVAARNGTCAAQVVVGTDRELTGLKVSVSDFDGPGKASLPASAAEVLYVAGHPAWELPILGRGKGGGGEARPGFMWYSSEYSIILDRHSRLEGIMRRGKDEQTENRRHALRQRELKRIQFFDHLRPTPPASIPADTCQPAWISVTVPRDLPAPGKYAATITVRIDGQKPVKLPLELEVADWSLPDPADFRTIVALEQSPYAVARRYKVSLWSEEHFRLMTPSYQMLAKVGNDFLMVPVIIKTEFGNSTDSPVRILRTAGGELKLDFSALDRYLDFARRHWGRVRCIAFVVDHSDRQIVAVYITDEATGKRELVKIGKDAPQERRRRFWRLLATGIHRHMQARGLGDSLHWGLHGDGVNDPTLVKLLKEFAPDVTWVRYSHRVSPNQNYTFTATVRVPYQYLTPTSRKGWKTAPDRVNLWLPRHWNGIAVCWGTSSPFAYRVGIERALAAGAPGVGRAGADYWDGTWLHDFPRTPYCGMPLLAVFWPGPGGAESSVRFEVFREGVQETEARIFIEQALEKIAETGLPNRIAAFLDRRIHDTIFAPAFTPHAKIEEYNAGWQGRSRELYQAAAKVARHLGVDLAASKLELEAPARGQTELKVTLRNWTAGARAWKLSSDRPWLLPRRLAGEVRGVAGQVPVLVDTSALEPGEPVTGALTLTDAKTGRTESVPVTARVMPVMRLGGAAQVANVLCNTSGELVFRLQNTSARELDWQAVLSAGWARAEPAAGKLPPGRQCPIRVKLSPPGRGRARHEVSLLLSESGGAEHHRRLVVHVMPGFLPPKSRPPGKAVPMESMDAKLLKSCAVGGRKLDLKRHRFSFYSKKNPGPARGGLKVGRITVHGWGRFRKQFQKGFCLQPGYEVTYGLEGQPFRSFAVEIGWLTASTLPSESREIPTLYFEVYVDGRLRAHSGGVGFTDPPRLLVVEGLAGAKEIRFLTRCHDERRNTHGTSIWGTWAEPAFYK